MSDLETDISVVEADTTHIPAKSLYGLTPKVEAAIMDAVKAGEKTRVRALTAPLHSADMADLLGRISPKKCGQLLRMLGDELDPEAIAYLDEEMLEHHRDTISSGARALREDAFVKAYVFFLMCVFDVLFL